MSTFLPAMWPAFFMRVSPASRNAKPACMNITRIAATTTQIVEAATRRSWLDTRRLEARAGPAVVRARNGRRPAGAVARVVAAARGIDDRRHDVVDDVIRDD